MKIRVLQTYPLKMNLVPEIRTDRKRKLETLPSTLLLQNLEWSNESRCELASYLEMTQTSHR
jgi:hypothetical protein